MLHQGQQPILSSEIGKEFGMFLEKKEVVWREHREQQGRGGQKIGRDWII